jgi:hypothetical protein
MKRCVHCGAAIDDETLVLCPSCKRPPGDYEADVPARIYKRLRRDVIRSFYLGVFGPFVLLGFVGSLLLVLSGIKEARHEIQKRITKEFQQPAIHKVVQNVAENQAKTILEDQVKPALESLQSSTRTIEDAKELAAKFEAEYRAKLESVQNQLQALRANNAITSLASRCVVDGDRKAFDALNKLYSDADDDDLKKTALASIFAVKSFYVTGSRTQNYSLKDYTSTLGLLDPPKAKPNSEYSAGELIQILESAADWRARAVSAQLLEAKGTKQTPEILLKIAQKDPHLEVVRNAKRSFSHLTGFSDGDVLKTDEMAGWWSLNSKEVLDKLPPE